MGIIQSKSLKVLITQCYGDIHKTNQILDEEGRIRYPGSTIQQNLGETNDKGFLVWSIRSKDDFDCKHVSIMNPTPFITIELAPDGTVPEDIALPLMPVVDAVVSIVPVAAGKVTVTVPATAGADSVTAPLVSPFTTTLAISFPFLLDNPA